MIPGSSPGTPERWSPACRRRTRQERPSCCGRARPPATASAAPSTRSSRSARISTASTSLSSGSIVASRSARVSRWKCPRISPNRSAHLAAESEGLAARARPSATETKLRAGAVGGAAGDADPDRDELLVLPVHGVLRGSFAARRERAWSVPIAETEKDRDWSLQSLRTRPPGASRCSTGPGDTSFEVLHEPGRRDTPPGGRDERLQFLGVDRGQAHQDRREAVVVRLGEEFLLVQPEHQVLLEQIRHPDGEHLGVGNAGLLWIDALQPDPGESLLLGPGPDREREPVLRLRCPGQLGGNPPDILLVGHGVWDDTQPGVPSEGPR